MNKRPKIAVMMELEWPLSRHFKVNAGIYDFASKHTNWQLDQCDYPEIFMKNGIKYDAIIGRISKSCYDVAVKKSLPMVNVWMNSPVRDKLPNVFIDSYEAGLIAAQHLYERGFKRFAQFGVYPSPYSAPLHYKGVIEIANKYNIPCESHSIHAEHRQNIKEWQRFLSNVNKIQKGWISPIGVIVEQDAAARSLATTLLNLGWHIPQDVAIVGGGYEEIITNSVRPTLSTVANGYFHSGYEAAKLLYDIMNGAPIPSQPLVIPSEKLIVQESSDAYAVKNEILANVLKFLSNNSDKSLSVDYVAQVSGVGRRTLERLFRNELNRSINDEIIRLRIERLKRLLVDTDAPVKTLCSQTGFGTEVHMHNIFKKYTGMTPIMFRKKHTASIKNFGNNDYY